MKYFPFVLIAVLCCSVSFLLSCCDSAASAPDRKGTVGDDGNQGAIVVVEHQGRTYVIWHHDGYQSESCVLLHAYETPVKP